MTSNSVVNLVDQQPDWPSFAGAPGQAIRKIVLGRTPGESGEGENPLTIPALPADFRTLFPHLTHLYLWNIQALSALPELPPSLECLDVRDCLDFSAITNLPPKLDTLVLERCPQLSRLPELSGQTFSKLRDLSLKGCAAIPEAWVNEVLIASPELSQFDASDCDKLTHITRWPATLDRIDLNQCAALQALPDEWPARLRRLGLRGAATLGQLPDFYNDWTRQRMDEKLDYVDLAGTRALRSLLFHWGRPRTLFLHGSGILMPPASEHGSSADENVAADTLAYFADVALTGSGEVKRCKLLILGNGSAGKTCLSLALTPGGNPAEAKRLGSTHGVQFHDWHFPAKADHHHPSPVHLHIWDFGGQEIYHNTHRLFMSVGAVFIVVWKPDQDGKQPAGQDNGFNDTWRSLQYWLDFIHLACPHQPRIAIVCSHHAAKTAELERQWRRQVRPEFHAACRCFYVDSMHRAGELRELQKWVKQEVDRVVAEQGIAVPAYWELAQVMVESWVQKLNPDGQKQPDAQELAAKNQMTRAEFQAGLTEFIRSAVKSDDRYAPLRAALADGRFALDLERTRRTLSFLTHSGWLYWDQRLLEERVIIGQKWALDAIYAVLERKTDQPVYGALKASKGKFTLAQLGEWSWNQQKYSRTEQELLLSFMQKCGLCFQLLRSTEAWRGEDVYVSFEHLPTAGELLLQDQFERRLPGLPKASEVITDRQLHRLHWQAFLTDAGAHYGKDAEYAIDGFYLENQAGEKLLVRCDLDLSGLGGSIEIQVGGIKPEERLKSAVAQVRQFLRATETGARPETAGNLGDRSKKAKVFISYAWEPAGIPKGYEVPVDAIEAYFKGQPVTIIRDKNLLKFGDNLRDFMTLPAITDHVIVVHSDKYWKSPYAIFELCLMNEGLIINKGKCLKEVVIPVEHLNSNIRTTDGRQEYIKHWQDFKGAPAKLGWQLDELKAHAEHIIFFYSDNFDGLLDLNLRWSDGPEKVLAAIAARLNLPPKPPAAAK